MPETDPNRSLLSATFELPEEDIPSFMNELGILALTKGYEVTHEHHKYNPELVSNVIDYETSLEHPSITLTSMKNFATALDEQEGDKTLNLANATKIHNAFSSWYYQPSRNQIYINDCFVQLSGPVATGRHRQLALKVDHAAKLLNHLKNGELKRTGVGPSAIGFFENVCNNLYEIKSTED